jgi:hypothetical protein
MKENHVASIGELEELPAPKLMTSNIFPKEAVEGVMAEMINQIKASLDVVVFGDEQTKLTKTQNVKATYQIVGEEVQHTVELLRDYTNASLTPKHRMCRAIMSEFLDRLGRMDVREAKASHSKHLIAFANELVEFLSVFHNVLKDKSLDDTRRGLTMDYCGFVPGANGGLH